jgi:fructokinase
MNDALPPVLFGEVLFDRFPDGSEVLGGAPLNVALHLQGFGLAPCLLSAVGVDLLGERILARMEAAGLDTGGVAVDPDHPTGTVEVALADGEPTFTITPEVAWDYIDVARAPAAAGLLYHGSLALRRVAARTTLARLRARLAAPVFLDVNLRSPWWSRDEVRALVATATWVKLNHDELATLADGADEASRAAALLGLGDVALVVVTRGADGAAAYPRDGAPVEVAPNRATLEVVDTVGAGDAFASVLICGLLRGWPLATTLERAQAFASRIVACRGAVPDDAALYSDTCAAWEIA